MISKGFTWVVCICKAAGQWFNTYIFLLYSLRLKKRISTRGVKFRLKASALWSLIIDTLLQSTTRLKLKATSQSVSQTSP